MLEEEFFWTSGPFFKAKFILLESDCSISGGLVFIYSAGHRASQFFTSYFYDSCTTYKKTSISWINAPPAINRIFQAGFWNHQFFIVNSNLPPLKLTFSPTSWLKDASFPYLGIRFLPPFFPSANWPSVSSSGATKPGGWTFKVGPSTPTKRCLQSWCEAS